MLMCWRWLVNLLMTVDCIDDEGLTQNAVARPSPLSAVQICVCCLPILQLANFTYCQEPFKF